MKGSGESQYIFDRRRCKL